MTDKIFPPIVLKDSTDWDYAAQYSSVAVKALQDDGYIQSIDEEYVLDDNTNSIWTRSSPVTGTIQVSLRKDLELFIKCWEAIDAEFYW